METIEANVLQLPTQLDVLAIEILKLNQTN
jgi:hypothetical protein